MQWHGGITVDCAKCIPRRQTLSEVIIIYTNTVIQLCAISIKQTILSLYNSGRTRITIITRIPEFIKNFEYYYYYCIRLTELAYFIPRAHTHVTLLDGFLFIIQIIM